MNETLKPILIGLFVTIVGGLILSILSVSMDLKYKVKEHEKRIQHLEEKIKDVSSKKTQNIRKIIELEKQENKMDDKCLSAKISSPLGSSNRQDALTYCVKNNVAVTWAPPNCVMTIEYYQNNRLQKKYYNMVSSSKINIGEPNSGETEIKIWREGSSVPSDSIWVWVRNICP